MKNDFYFIRYGNLNPVKHREGRLSSDDSNRNFHTAPVQNGIYAFPKGYIEPFLLSGSFTDNKKHFLLDDNGNKILENDFWECDSNIFDEKIQPKYLKLIKKKHLNKKRLGSLEFNGKYYVAYLEEPHRFKYEGELWCHLFDYVDRNDILETSGSWIKVDYKTYLKALKKIDTHERFKSYMECKKYDTIKGNPHTCRSIYSNDHYEVFIEKIK